MSPLLAVNSTGRRNTCIKQDCGRFEHQGVAAGPSNVAEDLAADEHVAARGMLIEVPRSDAPDPMLVVGNPVKMSHAAEGPITSFPGLGQHTAEVLSETLGLEAPELEALRSKGVIGLA